MKSIPLEEQVVALKTAKLLQEAGFELDVNYWWYKHGDQNDWQLGNKNDSENYDWHNTKIPTYTLPEMWAVLPKKIEFEEGTFDLALRENQIGYWNHDNSVGFRYRFSGRNDSNLNEATAAAKLLLWLKENGHTGGSG